ncbi:MAG: hypothetical protein M3292_02795 [Actinomycetota bacterium]|nr:hypothetical protein [Actinomycetota bacterium]
MTGVFAVTGCGGDGDGEENAVEIRGEEYAFVMPDRIEGFVSMEVSNAGSELHEYALGRVKGNATTAQLKRAFSRRDEDAEELVDDVGGVPLLSPGEEVTITRRLPPGTYVLLWFIPAPDGKPHIAHGMIRTFEVVGESDAEAPEADATIAATEEGFDVPGLEPGEPATFLGAMQTIPAGASVYLTADFEGGTEYTIVDPERGARVVFTPQ